MLVWRLVKSEYSPDLEGEGSRLAGGRWNSPGIPAIYCASSLALAALEVFVHFPPNMRRFGRFPLLETIGIEVPDEGVARLDDSAGAAELHRRESRAKGDRWLTTESSLALIVPSAVIPREMNVLLNPRHPRMAEVKVVVREPFRFDERLGG